MSLQMPYRESINVYFFLHDAGPWSELHLGELKFPLKGGSVTARWPRVIVIIIYVMYYDDVEVDLMHVFFPACRRWQSWERRSEGRL